MDSESAYSIEFLPFAVSRMAALTILFLEDLARLEAECSTAPQRMKMVNGWGRGRAGANSIFTGVFSEWCSFCVASLTRGLALASGYATMGALIRVVAVTLVYVYRVDIGRQVVSSLILIIGGGIVGERHQRS